MKKTIGYILDYKSRPDVGKQRSALLNFGVDKIVKDKIEVTRPVYAHMIERNNAIDIAVARGGYEFVILSPSCFVIGQSDGAQALNKLMEGNCSVHAIGIGETFNAENAGFDGVANFIAQAMAEAKSYHNRMNYAATKGDDRKAARAARRKLAYDLFLDRANELTITDIAKRVGVSVPTVRKYIEESK